MQFKMRSHLLGLMFSLLGCTAESALHQSSSPSPPSAHTVAGASTVHETPTATDEMRIGADVRAGLSLRRPVILPPGSQCLGLDAGQWEPACDLASDAEVAGFLSAISRGIEAVRQGLRATPAVHDLKLEVRFVATGLADGLAFRGPTPMLLARRYDDLRRRAVGFTNEPLRRADQLGPNETLACVRGLEVLLQLESPLRKLREELAALRPHGWFGIDLICREEPRVGREFRGATLSASIHLRTLDHVGASEVAARLETAGLKLAGMP